MKKQEKKFFYEGIAGEFDSVMNRYDLKKRLRIVFDELLGEVDLEGKLLLDAGCGTGWFSAMAEERGARVYSLDVGVGLLQEVAKKCQSTRVVGDVLGLGLRENAFDVVICSEVIEHTANPRAAFFELVRVVRPGGVLGVTVPNRCWHFVLAVAQLLKLRPYKGYENWVGWGELKRWCREAGVELRKQRGFHAFPFVFQWTHPLIDLFDRLGTTLWGRFMVNMAVGAKKRG